MALISGRYTFKNVAGGTYFDVPSSGPDANKAHGWHAMTSAPDNLHQQWDVQDIEIGYVIKNVGTGKWVTLEGRRVVTADKPHLWHVKPYGIAYAFMAGEHGAVDLDNGSKEDGATISVWGDGSKQQQHWIVEPVYNQSAITTLQNGLYTFKNIAGGTNFDVPTTGQSAYKAHGWRPLGPPDNVHQQWDIQMAGGGYIIKNRGTGKWVTVENINEPGTRRVITADIAHIWKMKYENNGHIFITTDGSERAIELSDGLKEDGTPILVARLSGEARQLWDVKRV